MTLEQKILRIMQATPGVVAHSIFAMHGVSESALRSTIHRIRKDGHTVDNVPTLGYRLRRAA